MPDVSPDIAMYLLCFPYAGASASIFRDWQEALPTWIRVVPVQPPGRGDRTCEPARTSIGALARDAQPMVLTLDKPFALFGHSLGALVAYDLARRCQNRGRPPSALLVSAHCAPHRRGPVRAIHNLPDTEFIAKVADVGGIPPHLLNDTELLEAILPMLRADAEAIATYRPIPSPRIKCPVTVFSGSSDPIAPPELAWQWSDLCAGPVRSRVLHGDHFFLRTQTGRLLSMIADELSETRAAACPLAAPQQRHTTTWPAAWRWLRG